MNFDLTEEQQLLQDSVSRFVADNYGIEQRRALAESERGYSEQHWQTFAELGWLALPFDEEDGGIGGSAIDTMIVMEQLGKGLVLEPFLHTVVIGGGLLKRTLQGAQREALLGQLIEGKLQLALAHTELQSRWDLHDIRTSAHGNDGEWHLSGTKTVVYNAPNADYLLVTARTSGSQRDKTGISLFLVPTDAAGLDIQGYPTVDGLRAAEVRMDNVPAQLLGEQDKAWPLLETIEHEAVLALSAESLGGMEVMQQDTVQYTQERVQFDHPLSDFQTVQHRLVEMFMEYEQCRSMLYRATLEFAQNGNEAARTIAGCKYLLGTAARFIGENAVQLHGGMGVTEELRLGHYFKRQLVIDSQFGNADFHLERFAA